MIISRKRFEEECNKRVDEAIRKVEERCWQRESERNKELCIAELEKRVIAVEKACNIDHPSHHHGENVRAIW